MFSDNLRRSHNKYHMYTGRISVCVVVKDRSRLYSVIVGRTMQ